MADLSTVMHDQALAGLRTQLDTAVTNGDTDAAFKVTQQIATLAVQSAPKAPPFGQADITAELDKQTWFGTDPRRSAKAVELGKTMDPKKFPTAAAFAEALVKAVDEEFKPAATTKPPPEGETDEEREDREAEEKEAAEAAAAAKKPRKTDGPSEGDATARSTTRTAREWTKISDAPPDIQKEINRTADKWAPKTKEGREGYVKRALESHFVAHQRKTKK